MTVDGAAGAGPTNAAAGASASATTRACGRESVAATACVKRSRRWRAIRPFLFSRELEHDPMRALTVASAVHFAVRESGGPLAQDSSGRNGLRPPTRRKNCKALSIQLTLRKPRRFESCKRVYQRIRSQMNRTKPGLQRDAVDCVHFCLVAITAWLDPRFFRGPCLRRYCLKQSMDAS